MTKPQNCSKKNWELRKYCSHRCKGDYQKGKAFHSPFGNTFRRGATQTEEAREKMSKAHTGKILGPHSLEHRNKISQANKANKGAKPLEATERARARREKKDWKDRPLSDFIRATAKYRHWRKSILERDNYTCAVCSKRKKRMQVHHKKKFLEMLVDNNTTSVKEAVSCENLWKLDIAITVCRSCHTIIEEHIYN